MIPPVSNFITENTPKTLNTLIRKLKAYYKDNPNAKQQCINGHFCYADKFVIITNGLAIIRHITFLDDDLKATHPEMIVKKKTDSPNEDKSIEDATYLKSVLSDLFSLYPDFHPDTFLGDSFFDTIETYGMLLNDFHCSEVLIPYPPPK